MFKESASVEASFEFVGRCVSSYRCHHSAREADLLTRDGLMPMLSAAWKARVRFRTWRKTDHTRCLKHINKAEHMSTRGCVALLSSPVAAWSQEKHTMQSLFGSVRSWTKPTFSTVQPVQINQSRPELFTFSHLQVVEATRALRQSADLSRWMVPGTVDNLLVSLLIYTDWSSPMRIVG